GIVDIQQSDGIAADALTDVFSRRGAAPVEAGLSKRKSSGRAINDRKNRKLSYEISTSVDQ
ncbi:MAG: hypothetical protein IKH70_05770, partial [Stomatobaculum sp.]|nr:hypothetical protein [Stomatobaculum sp.]